MNYREHIYRQYATRFQSVGYAKPDVVKHWVGAYKWFLRGWLPSNQSARILDVGCGGGQMLLALKKLGYTDCTGVDISLQQVEAGRSAGLDVHCCNGVEFLSKERRRWDLVIGIDILEHLGKDEAMEFLAAAGDALTPGGRLILQMPNPAGFGGMAVRYGDLTHEIALAPDCATRLLSLFEFQRIECRETGPVPNWVSPLGLTRFIAWQCLRLVFAMLDIIETGGRVNKIYTRVYLITACRSQVG